MGGKSCTNDIILCNGVRRSLWTPCNHVQISLPLAMTFYFGWAVTVVLRHNIARVKLRYG